MTASTAANWNGLRRLAATLGILAGIVFPWHGRAGRSRANAGRPAGRRAEAAGCRLASTGDARRVQPRARSIRARGASTWVYVPENLDRAKPAPVMVFQDGLQYNAPAVFDDLIQKRPSRRWSACS